MLMRADGTCPIMPGPIPGIHGSQFKEERTDMRLILDPMHEKDTVLGFAWLEPVSYGYDHQGTLQSILCKAPLGDDYRIELITVQEPELSEDLFEYYTVEMEGE